MSITRINPDLSGRVSALENYRSTGNLGLHTIGTLSETSQVTHPGFYKFGSVGGGLYTKWVAAGAETPGDYAAVCADFNGGSSGCSFGKLIVTSPRSNKIWLVSIWNGAWDYVRQI